MKKELFSISKIGILIGGLIITSTSFSREINPWKDVKENTIALGKTERHIHPSKYRLMSLNVELLQQNLKSVQLESSTLKSEPIFLSLPNPDGGFSEYRVFKNTTMHPDLEAKFPEIRTYNAVNVNNSKEVVKIDLTPSGFHAMILSPEKGSIFIDPYVKGDINNYQIYFKKDYSSNEIRACEFDDEVEDFISNDDAPEAFGSCELRTYRIAIAATGEYTAAVGGGTVAGALAAQVTTMNRVNGIYERDIAITTTIVANNNLLIYTNASTDPYTNNNGSTLLGQNQTNVDNIIGNTNYDIGHIFSTGGGGIAQFQSVCSSSSKARGVTGLPNPQGDAFDVDYVAHEIGHQFGGSHTFNGDQGSCSGGNRSTLNSYEPGSGSTIMAYAGICSPQNVQNNSDALFHGRSLEQIGSFITGASHTCPVKTPLSNSEPVMVSTNANTTIPTGTPFALTANATDADGDALTYTWEQYDRQITTQPPVATATTGPNFRAFEPSSSPTRYFPNLTALRSNGPFTWERLSTVARTYNFRVVVRDNATGGGCTDHLNVFIAVDGNSGPFIVTSQNTTGISWPTGSSQTVTWDVANTDAAPVSCANVDIFLSIDAGATYPITLATNVPNNGAANITVPTNIASSPVARVMVMCSNGTFFNISSTFHAITGGSTGINDLRADQSITSFYNNSNIELSMVNLDRGTYNMVIVNTLGQQLSNEKITIAKENEKLNIPFADKSAGIYYISIFNNDVKYTSKLLK